MENGQEEKESSPKPETPPEVMETEETEDKGASSSSPGTIPDYCFQSSPVYKVDFMCMLFITALCIFIVRTLYHHFTASSIIATCCCKVEKG